MWNWKLTFCHQNLWIDIFTFKHPALTWGFLLSTIAIVKWNVYRNNSIEMCTYDTKLIILHGFNFSVSFRKLWGVFISFIPSWKLNQHHQRPEVTMRCLLALHDFFKNPLFTRLIFAMRGRGLKEDCKKNDEKLRKKIEISIYFNYLISDWNECYCLLSIARFIHHLFLHVLCCRTLRLFDLFGSRLSWLKSGWKFVEK